MNVFEGSCLLPRTTVKNVRGEELVEEPSSNLRKGESTLYITCLSLHSTSAHTQGHQVTKTQHPRSFLVEEMISSVLLLKALLEGAAWSQAFSSPQASLGTSVSLLTWLILQRELGSLSLSYSTALALKASPDAYRKEMFLLSVCMSVSFSLSLSLRF